MTKKNLLPLVGIAVIVISAVGVAAYLINRHSSQPSQDAQKSSTGYTAPTTNPKEVLKVSSYHIVIPDRSLSCDAAIYSVNGSNVYSSKVAGFINFSVKGSTSQAADSIIFKSTTDARAINEKYKFGEITESEQTTQLQARIDKANSDVDNLNLNAWNQEVNRAKKTLNDSIKNGAPDNCFDKYIVKTPPFDTLTVQQLKSYR